MYAQIFLEEIYMFENKGKLNKQQLGKFGEYYAKMVLASHGFAIYTSEVDDHGIDFVAESGNEFLKFQVKTTTFGKGYPFVKKSKFDINDDRLYLILIVIREDTGSYTGLPDLDVFVIPASEWKNPQPPLVYHDYEGKRSDSEYGINISPKQYKNLQEYSLKEFLDYKVGEYVWFPPPS